MAKSSRYELDWSKLPEVYQDGAHDWRSGDWYFDADDFRIPLEDVEHGIYAHLAWYLFIKERQNGGTEA